MTRDRRLLLLLILLMAYGLFVVEGRQRPHEDTANDTRHRHRHRHESSGAKRNRHDLADRRSSWSQELDYDDESLADREDEEEEDDYDARLYYERSYPRTSRIAAHARTFESRYPSRSRRGGYRGAGWHDERRRGSPRYVERSYRLRPDRTHRGRGYTRNREAIAEYDSEEDEFDYARGRVHEGTRSDKHRTWWKNGRKHRLGAKHDPRLDGRKRHRVEDLDANGRSDERRRRYNASEWRPSADDDVDNEEEDEEDDEEDDDDASKENEEEDRNEYEEELDNDFYKSEREPPMKTYDDIIRKLTADDPSTSRPTVKRDYRNTEVNSYAKRNAYGNFQYEPRNHSRPLVHDRGNIVDPSPVNPLSGRQPQRRLGDTLAGKLLGSLVERKSSRNVSSVAAKSVERSQRKTVATKFDDTPAKTKSLEQDYDEYLNTPDNEKEEDLAKAGVEEDTGMQADVTNTDYAEDEVEDETPAAATTTSTTTTTTTSTTTTSTTTPRPVVTQNYDYRDTRAYEGGTGAQYNGYQPKNDYPPMSAHSIHKWQSLGTRESVKETRSNMQQYNKNGKTAEIREALQHAIKVSREGSCQWPRPRVIPVRDVYPSPSTTYIPHCAILHRCSDDTGCCRSEALTCVPKHSHRVELSFYTTNVGGGSVVEKLSFYNHTECECRERTEYETSNEKPSEQRVYRHQPPSLQPQNMRRAQPRKPCRCPSEFTPRITSEGECYCSCYENHQNCIKIRRGKGYFSLADRLCIQNEECATPSCEFGDYMRRQGKCPRKKDKFDAIANYHTNLNHRYRS